MRKTLDQYKAEVDLHTPYTGAPLKSREEALAAAIERALQREREQHQWPGNETAQRVAQEMWRAFAADPEMAEWSTRDLQKAFPGVSHVTADAIRWWILMQPRPLGPRILSPEMAEKIKTMREKLRDRKARQR